MLIFLMPLFGQTNRIIVDGDFSEWTGQPLYSDALGDPLGGDVDFGRLWVKNDDRYLILNIEVGEELLMQQFNNITLFIDSDNSSASGRQIHGIGAEIEWHFGDRIGILRQNGQTLPIGHAPIGIVAAPTVSSGRFEIAIDRTIEPFGVPLFSATTIKLVIADEGPGQDLLPDAGSTLSYTFDNTPPPPLSATQLARHPASNFRVLSYNVLVDGPFEGGRSAQHERVLAAIAPDIIGFCEIYSHSAAQTAAFVESVLPSGGQGQWYSAKVNPDIIAVSRYPISNSYPIIGNGAFLINLRPTFDSDLLLIVAHPPCCNNDADRQYEIDAMMAFVRDAINPGGVLDLLPNTPIMLVGDFNLVGNSLQLRTLLEGRIVNQGDFGLPFVPDWDETNLADLHPLTSGMPMTITWYNEQSSFSPGRLDFIIYTNSVLEVLNRFTLFTPGLNSDTLSHYNLQINDAVQASDHLPVVGDFRLSGITGIPEVTTPQGFILEQNYPNPFNPRTVIRYSLSVVGSVKLEIYNIWGNKVRNLISENKAAGNYQIQWDGRDDDGNEVAGGLYFYRLRVGDFAQTRKMLFIK